MLTELGLSEDLTGLTPGTQNGVSQTRPVEGSVDLGNITSQQHCKREECCAEPEGSENWGLQEKARECEETPGIYQVLISKVKEEKPRKRKSLQKTIKITMKSDGNHDYGW